VDADDDSSRIGVVDAIKLEYILRVRGNHDVPDQAAAIAVVCVLNEEEQWSTIQIADLKFGSLLSIERPAVSPASPAQFNPTCG
jgi:hypothetical protein